MGQLEKSAGRVNLWTALIERAGKLAYALGWEITPAKIVNAIWPTLLLVGGMMMQHIPWYIIAPVSVFALAALLHLYAGLKRAIAVSGVKKLALSDAADACERVERGFYDFTEARGEEVIQIISDEHPPDGVDFRQFWEERCAKEDDFMRRLKARIGSDVGAAVAMLELLDIPAESDLRSLHWADGMARYYGAVAKLLRAGQLDAARKLDRHSLFF